MSVRTTYDEKRDELREKLNECLKMVKEDLMDEDVWGYNLMVEDYDIELYCAVKKARDTI